VDQEKLRRDVLIAPPAGATGDALETVDVSLRAKRRALPGF
jgi:hypothetical protein